MNPKTTENIDLFLSELTLVTQLDSQITAIMFRLNALQNGKTLSFKREQDNEFTVWCPSFTNMGAILEGNKDHPSIIQMDVKWSITG